MTPRALAAPVAALVLLTASALWLAPAAGAQDLPAEVVASEARYVCALHDYGGYAAPGPVQDLAAGRTARRAVRYERVVSRQSQATLVVDYSSSFTAEARAAFQRAVDIWGAHLTSAVPIRIRADFDALDTNVLGQAGPRLIRLSEAGGRRTWYPFALGDVLLGRDAFPADADDANYDIEATFSSSFPRFYFGLDGRPRPNQPGQPGQIDFVSVVLHELGHGLGFIGSGDVDDGMGDPECTGVAGTGCVGVTGSDGLRAPIVFDRFLDDASGRSLLDATVYPNNSLPLGDLLQSGALFVDAPTVVRVYDGVAPVWAPSPFEGGSSFSHWDEAVVQGSSAALMTPRLASGEAYQDPGDITCAFFADMGWPLGPGCSGLVGLPTPAPLVDELTVRPLGPNPFRTETSYQVLLPEEGPMRAVLYDVLGRRVSVLFDGPARFAERLTVRADDLAPGLYRLAIQTDTEETVVSLTSLR